MWYTGLDGKAGHILEIILADKELIKYWSIEYFIGLNHICLNYNIFQETVKTFYNLWYVTVYMYCDVDGQSVSGQQPVNNLQSL
jgi:hypothetical protein